MCGGGSGGGSGGSSSNDSRSCPCPSPSCQMTSTSRPSPTRLGTSAPRLCAGLHEEKADDDDEVEVSEVEVEEIMTEDLSEVEVEEIMKERPLSVNTLHRLASATLKRAGRQFEYVRKEVVDNSASAGPPRRGQTVCGGSSDPQQGDARDDALHDGVIWRRELAQLLGNIASLSAFFLPLLPEAPPM